MATLVRDSSRTVETFSIKGGNMNNMEHRHVDFCAHCGKAYSHPPIFTDKGMPVCSLICQWLENREEKMADKGGEK
jgi:hypothetical protein